MSSAIKKPVLRGLQKAYLVRAMIVSSLGSCIIGWSYKHFVADPRKKRYADFYKDYNAEEEADRMYKMGIIRGYKDNDDPIEIKINTV